ncbi:MAG: RidA family protein [Vicinamibacterales bacterium]|nr:RidA family protein [Vicinamibacterales bacterium]
MNPTEQNTSRRSAVKSLFASIAGAAAGIFGTSRAKAAEAATTVRIPDEAQAAQAAQAAEPPLFSSTVVHGGLVFVSGKGEHGPGDITVHTQSVLNQIETELKKAGSSMDKVLKVNVYLHDIKDYDGMNAVYRGKFGAKPPVRTTVACYGGIPGRSLVEIDCIAAL